ncbi:hypothetical protein AMATHDRAFT_74791 [Amanita thiersii Skay4041]|uniref:Uncharacterized protein n=1 Tax=Amanita thiersii Skay4041 TaxID=703135 RepID=A0A2A9NTF4_9AGAR|nr:hypothetical protein AMATHDRAFT_74791 [Amanita thiersii Skay4041]
MTHHHQPFSPASGADTFLSHRGFNVPDPFAPRQRPGASFVNAILATTLFRCWHILVLFSAWSTLITVLNSQGYRLHIQATLLTVLGTVLGFVISYRTTSSFERYNEGRRLWSLIIYSSRAFARTVWFHVPDPESADKAAMEDAKMRALIEKKTVINLLEAFAVAVKHYLRGEDGIYYQDLYYLVKFLPGYALPAGRPGGFSMDDPGSVPVPHSPPPPLPLPISAATSHATPTISIPPLDSVLNSAQSPVTTMNPLSSLSPTTTTAMPNPSGINLLHQRSTANSASASGTLLPLPVTSPKKVNTNAGSGANGATTTTTTKTTTTIQEPLKSPPKSPGHRSIGMSIRSAARASFGAWDRDKFILSREEESLLLPATMPPDYHIFDLFPFSLLVRWLTEKGREVKGKKAARLRAKMRRNISHNVPLEISLYLSSYVAAIQRRKACDVPTLNILLASLNQLVESLTGLERILTTPIPFSYSIHLWVVTILYCLALPFQLWTSLGWITIPATIVSCFIFFGFLVAGEEIENPFGYDKNDLNLDHFTHNIIRNELRAVTSAPPPEPEKWAFSAENNMVFSSNVEMDERLAPEDWMKRGMGPMRVALATV